MPCFFMQLIDSHSDFSIQLDGWDSICKWPELVQLNVQMSKKAPPFCAQGSQASLPMQIFYWSALSADLKHRRLAETAEARLGHEHAGARLCMGRHGVSFWFGNWSCKLVQTQ